MCRKAIGLRGLPDAGLINRLVAVFCFLFWRKEASPIDPNDIIEIRSMDGMVWYIIPLEEGKKRCQYAVNHRFRGGRLAVEEKRYNSLQEALDDVKKQKERRDSGVMRNVLRDNLR